MSADVKVPLLDLKAQYVTIQAEVEAALRGVLASQHFILGPEVEALEKEVAAYCRAPHGIACASGSDALLLALMAVGVKPGDEVLCPTYTFFATAGAVARLGAVPVFVDLAPDTYNLDLDSTRRALDRCRRPKAVIPVHLFGQCANMAPLEALAAARGLAVIEDAAQAIGSEDVRGHRAGVMGLIGCFSFFPSKNLGAFGDGGLLTTANPELAEKLRVLRVHGSKPKYYHKVVGLNSRLDALQAAVLRVKLKHLDSWTAARQRNAAEYDRAFLAAGAETSARPLNGSGLPLRVPAPAPAGARHIYNQYVIRVPAARRDGLLARLKTRNIGAEVYYPVPLHRQECFAPLGYAEGALPHAEAAARETLALPVYPELSAEQKAHVVRAVVEFLRS